MARRPTVLSTSPSNYETNVATNTSLKATFDIDLDSRYISDFVYLLDENGNRVEGRSSYKKKAITFMPKSPLSMGTTYQFFITGDSDLNDTDKDGIRSIIGDCMAGNVIVTFTTEADVALEPPVIIEPMNQSIIRTAPVFKWESVVGAYGYQLQISTSNQFGTLVYPTSDDIDILQGTTFEPSVTYADGLYYFRIRSVRDDGVKGEWSHTMQFHLKTTEDGTIAEGDSDPLDATDDGMFGVSMELELIEEFPKSDMVNVPTNVNSIYFRVIGDFNPALIDEGSFRVVGRHVSDDWEETSHGELTGRTTIVESNDGTTYIIFTPDPIQ